MSDLFFWSFVVPNIFFGHSVLPNIILSCGDIESNPGPNEPIYSNQKCINIGHVNVRSLLASVSDPYDCTKRVCKFELIKNHILYYQYDIFGISETWLDDKIDMDLNIPGYHLPVRRDFNRHQRGLMVYISQTLCASRRSDLEPRNEEISNWYKFKDLELIMQR